MSIKNNWRWTAWWGRGNSSPFSFCVPLFWSFFLMLVLQHRIWMGCRKNIVCLEGCKVEGIWLPHLTCLSVPATSLAGPEAMYDIAAAMPWVWMWLTQRALQNTRIQQWDTELRAGMMIFLTIWRLSQMSTEFQVRQWSCFWPRGYLSVQENSHLQTVERWEHLKVQITEIFYNGAYIQSTCIPSVLDRAGMES